MYKESFYLTGRHGNNAFAWGERGESPQLYVPAVIDGTIDDVQIGDEVVFEDLDDGELQSCIGLKNFVRFDFGGVPAVIMDNHNHAFYFWHEFGAKGAKLLHVDQHKDMRRPDSPFDGDAFKYTNEVLNVGNYIVPAMDAGIIGDVTFVTGEADLDQSSECDILNLDLDFFAKEMDYIDFDRVKEFLRRGLKSAKFVTIATSPFFIEQERAIEFLHKLAL